LRVKRPSRKKSVKTTKSKGKRDLDDGKTFGVRAVSNIKTPAAWETA